MSLPRAAFLRFWQHRWRPRRFHRLQCRNSSGGAEASRQPQSPGRQHLPTGVSNLNVELGPKQLEVLREMVPSASIVGLLVNPTSPTYAENCWRSMCRLPHSTLGLQVGILSVSSEFEFDDAFAKLVELRADALVIASDPLFNSRSEQLAKLAARHRLPTIHQFREFAALGGLVSYGAQIGIRIGSWEYMQAGS